MAGKPGSHFGRTAPYKGGRPAVQRTHCTAGHVLAEHGYLVTNGNGGQSLRCRTCHKARCRAYKMKKSNDGRKNGGRQTVAENPHSSV